MTQDAKSRRPSASDAGSRRGAISRRDLLRRAGAVGAVAATGGWEGSERPAEAAAAQVTPRSSEPSSLRGAYEHLTAEEAELLEAIAEEVIPADKLGPGAVEAGAVRYIDRALGGGLSEAHQAYRVGLAALDRYCRASRGSSFITLSPADRVSVLTDVETGVATGSGAGFTGSSSEFFVMVRDHLIQGTFGDPYYGGNANFVGWDLIRYPGVRTAVTSQDQARLEAGTLPAYRRSAYEWDTFEKAVVSRRRRGGQYGD